MNQPDEDKPRASDAEHFALDFPYRKSVKIRRDLKHFDLWLRATYEITIDRPIPLAFVYKDFFLSHVALYPHPAMPGRLLSAELENELRRSGLLEADELSCQQVASIILSVIRWQQHRYKKIDAKNLLQELLPLYRQFQWMTRNKELTYQSTLKSSRVLNVFRRHLAQSTQAERDLLMILLTWGYGFSQSELVQLNIDSLQINRRPLNWTYLRSDAPVKLDHMTAVSMFTLLCENVDLMDLKSHWLMNRQDGARWRVLTESEIEIILERHYRYAGGLYGFDYYYVPGGSTTPDLLPQEEAAFTKALKRFTKDLFAVPGSTEEEHEDDDWDAAVRKISLQRISAEAASGIHDEQVDWDAFIQNKGSSIN
ncbi:hypothetical protein [Pseudomonas sp. BMS12]|uniref:hypothetical protein n=1 Tax=Pseudomonas sp. BMS12 TaxID=1796033 RepID=UPI0012905575|nr:hypothetical protein [Pseudomonas sp. BMS12]